MNGYMATKMYEYKGTDIYEKNLYVRQEATKFWNRMNYSSKRRLDNLSDIEIKTDLVATMFVLILQIFGRLCRVTDDSKIHLQFILLMVPLEKIGCRTRI